MWNNTDQALLLNDSLVLLDFLLTNVQRFQAKASNLLVENFFGFTVDLGGTFTQAVIVYQQPDTILHFPVEYGDAWNAQAKFGIDLNPTGQNILLQSTQSRETTIDGWGTVQTPYDTFENVLRLRSEIIRLDTIVSDTGVLTLRTEEVEYMWLDTNYTLPVMKAHGIILENDSVVITMIDYIYERTCPVPTWTLTTDGSVFYLDESGMVTIDFTILNSNADEYDWDLGDGQFAESTGSISHTYTSAGDYSVVIGGCMTNCLPLNSCGFQIVDFMIVDSTTSLAPVDGNLLGINLYPNPADEYLNVYIPAGRGHQRYQIYDMTGKPVEAGIFQHDRSIIDTKAFANGLYTIQFSSLKHADEPRAYIRFMISR